MATRREAVLGALGVMGGAILPTQQAVERVNQAGPSGSPTNPGYSLRQQHQEDRAAVSARARYEAALEGWKRRPGEQEDPELPASNMYEKDEEAMQEILAVQSEKYRDPEPPAPAPAPAEPDSFERVYQTVTKPLEGGYTDGRDLGESEATNYGVQEQTLRRARKTAWGKDLPTSVRNLSPADAQLVYRKMYWEEFNIKQFKDPAIQAFAFDTAVHGGFSSVFGRKEDGGRTWDPRNNLEDARDSRLLYLARVKQNKERIRDTGKDLSGNRKTEKERRNAAVWVRNYRGMLNRVQGAYEKALRLRR